jgi:hypothetical protein
MVFSIFLIIKNESIDHDDDQHNLLNLVNIEMENHQLIFYLDYTIYLL